MPHVQQLLAPLSLAALALCSGCATPPRQATGDAVANSPQDTLKRSALWLFATAGGPSGAKAECQHVHRVLEEETRCQRQLCKPGRELAGEWLDNCSKLTPDLVEAVSGFEAALGDQVERKRTACAAEFQRFRSDGCQPDKCVEQAQDWATRCGGTEAGPLAVVLVEDAVNRRLGAGEGIRLDARSCPTIAKLLLERARCADEKACKKAWPEVEVYRARCESDERLVDLPTGLAQLGIAVGAALEPETLLVSLDVETVAPDAVPLTLADGTGAVLGLCHQRPVEPADYLRTRERCVNTELLVARLVKGSGSGALRIGRVVIPPGVELTGPYPWLALADEPAAQATVHVGGLREALEEALAAPEAEQLAKLVQTVNAHARFIAEVEGAQAVLLAREAKLAPLLGRLAALKVAGARGLKDKAALRGLAFRAARRPFADVGLDGAFALGGGGGAYWLDLGTLLRTAMKSYVDGLRPLGELVGSNAKPSATELGRARQRAADKARACRAASAKRVEAARLLEECVFTPCDGGRPEALVADWRTADGAAQQALREADLALSTTGASAVGSKSIEDAGCSTRPW